MSLTLQQSLKRIFTCFLAVLFLSVSGCYAQQQLQFPQVLKQQVSQQLEQRKMQLLQALPGGLRDKTPFPVGASVNVKYIFSRPSYKSLLEKEFSSLTTENAMKPLALHPAQNTYTFGQVDSLVAFAQANKMRVHGHTLIWSGGLPKWIKEFKGSQSDWDNMMKDHIQTIVRHFKGKVSSWDVVNEAIEDNGTFQKNIWYNNVGPDYIEKAYRYAHEADPDAKLFYNDFGHEYSQAKRKAIGAMVKDFRQKGVPLDGLGMQFHTRRDRPTADFKKAIVFAANTGLLVHISELDIEVSTSQHPTLIYDDDAQQQQAAAFAAIFRDYAQVVPVSQRWGITFWGVTDADSWIPKTKKRADWPLLFDGSYQRKMAYDSVMRAVGVKTIF